MSVQLFLAISNNDVARVQSIIDAGTDISTWHYSYMSALHWAAYYDLDEMIDLLVANGADVDAHDINYYPWIHYSDYATALHIAAGYNNIDAVNALLDAGANINTISSFHMTPLAYAVYFNSPDAAKLLVRSGADIGINFVFGSIIGEAELAGNTDLKTFLIAAKNNTAPVINTDVIDANETATIMGQISATDADQDQTLTYAITGGNDQGFFAISDTGEITRIKALNDGGQDVQATYDLEITVSDSFRDIKKIVTLNIDRAPIIPTQSFNAPVKTDLVNLNTFDIINPDGDVLLFTLTGDVSNHFVINEINNGYILLLTESLDYDAAKHTRILTVEAEDWEGNKVETDIIIKVNAMPVVTAYANNAPILTNVDKGMVSENDSGAETGITFTIDDQYLKEPSSEGWTIIGTDSEKFEVVKDGNQWKLKLKANESLDHESGDTREFTIKFNDGIQDSDAVSVVIDVTDVNEAPIVESKTVYISEDIVLNQLITTVDATDPEGDRMRYRITDGDSGNKFSIDNNTGDIRLISPLDQTNLEKKIVVTVSDARDRGTEAVITFDFDPPPVEDVPPILPEMI